MFTGKTELPKYNYILFRDTINNKTLKQVNETDIDKLNEMIKQSLSDKNFRQAELYAEKMSLFHGVPGLISYYNVMLKALASDIFEGETVDQEALNVLSYLYLAKKIFELDKSCQSDIARLMPDEQITDEDYWKNKVAEMGALIDLKLVDENALKIGNSMYRP